MILRTMPDIDAVLERVPGKVVAVHSSYRSRAAERGTMPAWPSYFLKPASSLAANSAGSVTRCSHKRCGLVPRRGEARYGE